MRSADDATVGLAMGRFGDGSLTKRSFSSNLLSLNCRPEWSTPCRYYGSIAHSVPEKLPLQRAWNVCINGVRTLLVSPQATGKVVSRRLDISAIAFARSGGSLWLDPQPTCNSRLLCVPLAPHTTYSSHPGMIVLPCVPGLTCRPLTVRNF